MAAGALHLEGVAVRYPGLPAPVLDVPSLSVEAGEQVAVTGPSGAGKTTLVNVVAGLERPQAGAVCWGDTDIAALAEGARDAWRARAVGLVMQDFHLFKGLSALDNIVLPHGLRRWRVEGAMHERALFLLAQVGLSRPGQDVGTMSRGEMQRVAVARALLHRPAVLVADEPTASLDRDSAVAVADLLISLAAADGATLLVVTHDHALAGRLDRRIALDGGRIVPAVRAAA